MLAGLPTPAIIAHRGASAYAPENTLAAFKLAIEMGADGIELDVRLSRDQEVVVIHDGRLGRTTDGNGLVSQTSLAELKGLDAGSWYGPKFKGETLPTLEEVIILVGGKAALNIELKGDQETLINKTIELIQRYNLGDRVIISSFKTKALRKMHKNNPELPQGLLILPGLVGSWVRTISGKSVPHQTIHPYFKDVNADMLRQAHQSHRPLLAWTVNNPEVMRRLFTMGVDGIITNDPLLARQVRAEGGQ
jgi:glycerophosphoryl diester phosphodiesterase